MKPRRILIIRPDRIGDVVLTTPLIRAVKESFPDSFIGVMVNSVSGVLLQHNPHIDILITDDPQGKDSGRSGFWNQIITIRKFDFDTGLMPLPRERHAWMMFLSGIKRRIGVGGKLYQIITAMNTVSRNKYIPIRHEADYIMDLGRKIGVINDDIRPELFITSVEREQAKQILIKAGFDISKPIIGINPSSNRSVPNWTPNRYVDLINTLPSDYQLFINIGIRNEELERHFSQFKDKNLIYSGNDLRELIALCSFCSVLVSSSTGTQHIAAALKIPTVTMFCPLTACSPKLWGSLGNRSETILPPKGYCQDRCPGDPKICFLDEITVESVVAQIKNVIKMW